MNHGNKSVLVCVVGAVALAAVLAGCARSNSVGVAAIPVNTQQASKKTAAPAESMPEVVVGASRGDEAEVVVKGSRNDPKLVALSEHKAH